MTELKIKSNAEIGIFRKFYLHYLQQASLNLMVAKLRSGLAILGILIGTAAIVALISCSQLATATALAQFTNLGTDLIVVNIFNQAQTKTEAMSVKMWQSLATSIHTIQAIAPYNIIYPTISSDGHKLSGVVVGANAALAKILHINLAQGYFISALHSFESECVIGHNIATQLQQYTLHNPIGQTILVGNRLYSIIGIAAKWQENNFFTEDINQAIIIPIQSTQLLTSSATINNAIISAKPNMHILNIVEQIRYILHINIPDSNLFIRSAQQIIDDMQKQSHIFTLLLGIIGSIALLVGGIGIMNVMLVAVGERIKEIGIRKAIGATQQNIRTLFLTESVLLSMLGGILGCSLGILITWITATINQWSYSLHYLPVIIGLLVAFSTGIFFGFYPATRAARLQPIVCLRQE